MSQAPIGGADFLIIEAIMAGHEKLLAIAKFAKVEPSAAREALERLRTTGRVRRYGATKKVRYVLVQRRRT